MRSICMALAVLLSLALLLGGCVAVTPSMESPTSTAENDAATTEPTATENPSVTAPDAAALTTDEVKEIMEKYLSQKNGYNEESISYTIKSIVLYGESQGWSIYFCTGGVATASLICRDIGGKLFYSPNMYKISSLGLFATDGTTVYTLEEAYEAGVIDIDEVYELVPESYRTSNGMSPK